MVGRIVISFITTRLKIRVKSGLYETDRLVGLNKKDALVNIPGIDI